MNELLIEEHDSILHAMKRLDSLGRKVLFLHDQGRLLAALTDGDIRRWILSGGLLSAEVRCAANYAPKFLYIDKRKDAYSLMKKYSIEAVPLVDSNKQIIEILHWDDKEPSVKPRKNLDIPVVMMAGGLGTRLYPYTKILPKPLIPVGEIPIAELIMNRFHEFGCSRFYLIVNHKKNMIKAYFNEIERDYEIHYVDEDRPMGTGGGLSLLKGKLNSTFFFTNCDTLIEEDLDKVLSLHSEAHNLVTMICSLKQYVIPYGVIDISPGGEIEEMLEKPEFSYLINTGCYIVEPRVLDRIEPNTSIGFPEILKTLKQEGERIGFYPISESKWLDVGQIEDLKSIVNQLDEDK